MKIVDAEFLRSCASLAQCPRDGLHEVACVGRSNVGKSSLINALLQRKKLAKVSRTPGKTRLLNYFRISTSDPVLRTFYLVDLPGYGYAKVAKTTRADWGRLLDDYFAERAELRAVLHLVDARVLEEQDVMTYRWLSEHGHPPIVVITKIDKLTRNARAETLRRVRTALHLSHEDSIVPCSSVTGEGVDALRHEIRRVLIEGH